MAFGKCKAHGISSCSTCKARAKSSTDAADMSYLFFASTAGDSSSSYDSGSSYSDSSSSSDSGGSDGGGGGGCD